MTASSLVPSPRSASLMTSTSRLDRLSSYQPVVFRLVSSVLFAHKLSVLCDLALSSGRRQGELFGLRWKDVDLAAATLTVVTVMQRSRSSGTRLIIHALLLPRNSLIVVMVRVRCASRNGRRNVRVTWHRVHLG